MYMWLFAQECYPKFNWIATKHFMKTPWKVKIDFKKNIVRIWQKINEY